MRHLWMFSVILASCVLSREVTAQEPLQRIAFGSCAKQDKPQPIWDSVIATKPQLFLFIGDNIYGDTEDMEVLKQKWNLLGAQPGYQKLKQTCPVLATWDDHDYGTNDAGADYPKKRESQQIFQDFFGIPNDSPRRQQEGVYHAEVLGPPGRRVQIILLDARYFRSRLKVGFQPSEPGEGYRGKYVPDTDPGAQTSRLTHCHVHADDAALRADDLRRDETDLLHAACRGRARSLRASRNAMDAAAIILLDDFLWDDCEQVIVVFDRTAERGLGRFGGGGVVGGGTGFSGTRGGGWHGVQSVLEWLNQRSVVESYQITAARRASVA